MCQKKFNLSYFKQITYGSKSYDIEDIISSIHFAVWCSFLLTIVIKQIM